MRRADRHKTNKKWKWIMISLFSLIGFGVIGYFVILFLGSQIVDEEALILAQTTTMETVDGEVIAELYQEDRSYVKIDTIPSHVKDAYLAIEDRRFYEHAGVDLKSVARAVYRDIIAMNKVEGASTITQQLAKNLFLDNDKTWSRKAKELMAAIYLEKTLSKDEILELYLNEIYFGHGVYGIEKAANFYFSKSVSELSISEGALLAGLAKAPNGYSPINHPDRALERRNVVLGAMEDVGIITPEERQVEQDKDLGLQVSQKESLPWMDSYIDLVIKEAQQVGDFSTDQLSRGGYRIIVGLDKNIQKIAYDKFQVDDYFPGNTSGVEGSFLMMDQEKGKIVSAIGGRNYQLGNLNRINVERQPGSTFKPLAVYAPALMQEDFTAYSLLPDVQTATDEYIVANVDNTYDKVVSLYESLITSKNVPAVWLLQQIGVQESKSYLEKMDMDIDDEGLAIALGGLTKGVTPMNLVEGYRTFASGGRLAKAYTIEKIYDSDDELIYEHEPEEEDIFTPQVAWDITEMLTKAVDRLPEKTYTKALAGKTGTTQHPLLDNEVKDAWFVGYTPDYIMTSWMGYDITDEEHYLTEGSAYPAQLTQDILSEIDKIDALPENFEQPDDVEELLAPVQIAPVTNLQANYEFGGLSVVRAQLSWEPLEDDRVVYRIYEEREGIDKRVGEVEGESEFFVNNALFKGKRYYIVAYDPLTKLESEKSETVELELTF